MSEESRTLQNKTARNSVFALAVATLHAATRSEGTTVRRGLFTTGTLNETGLVATFQVLFGQFLVDGDSLLPLLNKELLLLLSYGIYCLVKTGSIPMSLLHSMGRC